jgi:tetrahydromethanopterin S-methyltransferase subunit H
MASITVKKNDGTTDIVFDALTASGGEGIPAVWRQDTGNTAGLPVGLRSQFSLASKWNGPKTARQMKFDLSFPYAVQDSTTTIYSAKDRVVYSGIITVPAAIPASAINEAVAQGLNLLAAALVKSSCQAGYAPT